jgi:cytochrome o ubiquinol oxidase operon protein cyoD
MDAHAQAHGDHHADHAGLPHFVRKEYVTGFLLAAVLTAIPFWLVMGHPLPGAGLTAMVVMGLAAVQVVVHMVYFLHMNSRSEGGWTLVALLFTALLVGIVLSGSLWVMFHLDHNMMPMSPMDARQAP